MYQAISQIPMKNILDKLGIKYTVLGSSLGLWDGGKLTDGWRVKTGSSDQFATDFAGKGRACGNNFAFVKKFLQVESDKEVFDWFSHQFGLENKNRDTNKNKKSFHKKRESMKLPQYHSNW